MERVVAAIAGLEQRLQKKLELLDGCGSAPLSWHPGLGGHHAMLLKHKACLICRLLPGPWNQQMRVALLLAAGRYARVANMIEIEVEVDADLPAAEVAGIEEQIQRLQEVAEMQDDWRLQAEAQDEVERLLRAT